MDKFRRPTPPPPGRTRPAFVGDRRFWVTEADDLAPVGGGDIEADADYEYVDGEDGGGGGAWAGHSVNRRHSHQQVMGK